MSRKLNKKYYANYMKIRYEKRRNFALDFLGNKCISCGSTENLEFDHIDRKLKSFTIAEGLLKNINVLIAELKKCQLLCLRCHQKKTLKDLNQTDGRNSHGTQTSYKYCKCNICVEANSKYQKEYRRKKLLLDINTNL